MNTTLLKAFHGAICGAVVLGLSVAATAQSVKKEEEAAAPAEAPEGMVELEFELPEPFFGGTPLDYWDPNLEKEDFRDRPPFYAPEGTKVVSAGQPVTSSDEDPIIGELKQLVDGDKDYAKKSLIELGEGVQWVQVDLGAPHEVYAIVVWHFHEGKRVYFDIVAKVSNDPEFKDDVNTVYNNDSDNSAGLGVGEDKMYVESNKGRLIPVDGVTGQYVRLYSNGNTANDLNNYVEVEVWGKPANG